MAGNVSSLGFNLNVYYVNVPVAFPTKSQREGVGKQKKKAKINTHMNHDCKNSCVQLMTRISTRNYTIYGRCNVCSRPVRYEVRNPVDVSIFRAAKRGGHAHLGVSGVAEEGKAKGRINA